MTEQQNKLYEKAKQYAKENVKGNCDELKCLAVMLYEFAEQETKVLSKHILELKADKGRLTDKLTETREIIREMIEYVPYWTGEKHDKPRVYAMPDHLREKAEAFINKE